MMGDNMYLKTSDLSFVDNYNGNVLVPVLNFI